MPLIYTSNKNIIRQNIRNKIRLIRNHLTKEEQHQASRIISNYIINDHRMKHAKNIGLFINFDGEIETKHLIKMLLYLGKKIYLPIISTCEKSKILLFSQYTSSTPLIRNKFKIYEPKLNKQSLIKIRELHILFIPLVSFDQYGNRLGMGGGYYDHTLKNWIHNTNNFLIGLAHDCQKSDNIPAEIWDIFLPEIITPSTHWVWENRKLIKKLKYKK